MSLRDAITEFITQLEDDWNDGNYSEAITKSYARQLKGILKATEGEVPATSPSLFRQPTEFDVVAQTERMVAIEREKIRKEKGLAEGQESYEGKMIYCVDGPANGDMAKIDPNMPQGAYTAVNGHRYRLANSALVYAPQVKTQ